MRTAQHVSVRVCHPCDGWRGGGGGGGGARAYLAVAAVRFGLPDGHPGARCVRSALLVHKRRSTRALTSVSRIGGQHVRRVSTARL
eukprot:SAG31_NODE_489_length_14938_cov_5.644113_18_plen_86_part_00